MCWPRVSKQTDGVQAIESLQGSSQNHEMGRKEFRSVEAEHIKGSRNTQADWQSWIIQEGEWSLKEIIPMDHRTPRYP